MDEVIAPANLRMAGEVVSPATETGDVAASALAHMADEVITPVASESPADEVKGASDTVLLGGRSHRTSDTVLLGG